MAEKRDYILIASSEGEGEEASENGIIKGHAYGILKTIEFTLKDSKVRLL